MRGSPVKIEFTPESLNRVLCPPSGHPKKPGRVYVYDKDTNHLAYCITECGHRRFYIVKWVNGKLWRTPIGESRIETQIEQRHIDFARETLHVILQSLSNKMAHYAIEKLPQITRSAPKNIV